MKSSYEYHPNGYSPSIIWQNILRVFFQQDYSMNQGLTILIFLILMTTDSSQALRILTYEQLKITQPCLFHEVTGTTRGVTRMAARSFTVPHIY